MFEARIAKKLDKFGEQFTCDGNTYNGIFHVAGTGTLRTYLDDVQMMAVNKPGLMLVTDPDADIVRLDTITRDGIVYTVYEVSLQRISGTAALMIVILIDTSAESP